MDRRGFQPRCASLRWLYVYLPAFALSIFTDRESRLTKLLSMNLCMTVLTKSRQAMQTFKFMPDNRYTTYFIDFVMYFQTVSFATHLAFMPITNANLTFNFFPIGIILQLLPIFRRSPLLVCKSAHYSPPFSTDFLQ